VAALLAKAEAADQTDIPDGLSIPEELARREDRLEKLAVARAKIEARAKERLAREMAEHEAKLAARQAKTAVTGKKPGGKPPQPPVEGPLPTDQINLTDEASRIMPVAGGGFEQCYNAQAAVAADSLLVIAADVVRAPNDKQQIGPMLSNIDTLPDELGEADTLLADTGYFSAANVAACEAAGIDPLIAMGRQPHHPPLDERFADDPLPPEDPTPVEAMAHRLKTREGRDLYALRKQIPEPVFGIIKSVMGFRQFLLRGIDKVRGEWKLVTMAWNRKRMFTLCPQGEPRDVVFAANPASHRSRTVAVAALRAELTVTSERRHPLARFRDHPTGRPKTRVRQAAINSTPSLSKRGVKPLQFDPCIGG
jgi:hypothetical protein